MKKLKSLAIIIFCFLMILENLNNLSYGQDKKVEKNLEKVIVESSFNTVNYGWAKAERCKINNANFPLEDYPKDGRGDQDKQRLELFGSKQPHSSQFLLYYAPGWDKKEKTTPILLVHGANDNADRAWANPGEYGFGCGAPTCPKTGLMQSLVEQGNKVFAINFPHKHGDNLLWAQQIGAAISRIKTLTDSDKVDVIAWSKGAFASRIYASNIKPSWGESYANDIRKLFLIGAPNLGIDFAFRHGTIFNIAIFPELGNFKINGPSVHNSILHQEKWQDHPELSIYTTRAGNFFPGQKQMLRKLDEKFPLAKNEPDWQTTYYGGKGNLSESLGIQAAIDQGSLVNQVLSSEIPKSINTYLLAGNSADIPLFHNEHTGPSDGLVFVDSATHTAAIANLSGSAIIEANHLSLTWHNKSVAQINEWLKK